MAKAKKISEESSSEERPAPKGSQQKLNRATVLAKTSELNINSEQPQLK